jgi:hypothetical protein
MIGRVVVLFALFSASCASAPAAPPAPEPVPLEYFTYRTTIASVPEGASRVLVSVRVPESAGGLRPLHAYGLVGNAPFDFSLTESSMASGADGQQSSSVTEGPASLSWNAGQESGARYREFIVETHGKPLELSLRLAQMTGTPIEAGALEQELARGTTATVDGKPVEALATRLERVK